MNNTKPVWFIFGNVVNQLKNVKASQDSSSVFSHWRDVWSQAG